MVLSIDDAMRYMGAGKAGPETRAMTEKTAAELTARIQPKYTWRAFRMERGNGGIFFRSRAIFLRLLSRSRSCLFGIRLFRATVFSSLFLSGRCLFRLRIGFYVFAFRTVVLFLLFNDSLFLSGLFFRLICGHFFGGLFRLALIDSA